MNETRVVGCIRFLLVLGLSSDCFTLGREGVQGNRRRHAREMGESMAKVRRYGGVGGMAPPWSARCVQKGVNHRSVSDVI